MLVLREHLMLTEPSSPTSGPGKILVVHSHQPTLESLKYLLEEHQYCVQTASGGELALQSAREFLPDIILIGTLLPDMAGFEVCQQLKAGENTSHISVLFVLSSEHPEDKEKIFQVGGSDYITEPYRHEEILSRLSIHLVAQRLKAELEIERSEKAHLSQENKRWEQSFNEQVKQRTLELEVAFINERSAREQMINAASLNMMIKMSALVVQELGDPLHAIHQNLIHSKELAQENPGVTESLEYLLGQVEDLVKTITELNQICEL